MLQLPPLEKLKYPIGQFNKPEQIDADLIERWVNDIQLFPQRLQALVEPLSIAQLNWQYRPEGWKIKQLVHHCADSHLNSIIRFKLALTEDSPTIRPYYEDRWANLADSLDDDITDSLSFIQALHKKWVSLLKNLTPEDLQKEFIHPEHNKRFSLAETVGTYAWHCNHHLAHIKQAIEYKGNFS